MKKNNGLKILVGNDKSKTNYEKIHINRTEGSQSPGSVYDRILFLQRNIGNQAVGRLIKSGARQTRLRIGKPCDVSKQEADRVADAVMRMPEVSKEASDSTPEIEPELESHIRAIRGGGKPLPGSVRAFYEQRFGHDLSSVRVYTGPEADRSARALRAEAYTVGNNIIFRAGRYTPEYQSGGEVLAHELAHSVQQGSLDEPQSRLEVGAVDSPLERQAEAAALAVMNGERLPLLRKDSPATVRRITDDQLAAKSDANQIGHSQRYEPTSKEPKAQRDRIAAAIRNRDLNAIQEIADFREATDEQRLQMILIIHSNSWVGPLDEAALERIWSSFGSRIPLVASTNWNLWLDSISRGAELDDLIFVEKVKGIFLDDVKKTALDFLLKNRLLAGKEKVRLGIGVSGADVTPAQQTAALTEVQKIAQHLLPLQEAQDALRRVHVGYEVNQMSEVGSLIPAFYNPSSPPTFGLDPQDIPPGKPWPVVNEAYQTLTAYIARFSSRYPSIYALVQSRKLEDVANASQPQARSVLVDQLNAIIQNIDKAEPMIATGELDSRELWPIHRQLFEGKHAPSGLQWSQTFYMWAAEDLVKEHQSAQFWTNLGLTTLASAAFIVSEIASFGTATFFIAAGVGLGIGFGQAAALWEKADVLSAAAHSTASDELSLVYNEQASAKKVAAILATAQGILNAAGLAARGVSAAIARPPPSPAGPAAPPPGIRGVVQPDGTIRPIATGTGMPTPAAPSVSTGTGGAPAAAGGGAEIYQFPTPQGAATGPVTTGGPGSFFYSGGAAAPKISPAVTPAPAVHPIPTPVTTPAPVATPAPTPGFGVSPGAPFYATGAAAGAGAATQASQQTQPAKKNEYEDAKKKQPPIEVILRLPAVKRKHLTLYQGLVRLRKLIHDADYERDNDKQLRNWDNGIKPGSGLFAMPEETYLRGYQMGLGPPRANIKPGSANRILRPNWSRDIDGIIMAVDHIVELQVVPSFEWTIWDSFFNYELLDESSNSSSGSVLKNNIWKERERLAKADPNYPWMTAPLFFTKVELIGGNDGHRWMPDEIHDGEHLQAYRRHRGEIPDGR